MQTVLMISYHFPPEEGTCSEKNSRIYKLLKESGFNVKVLTINKGAIDEDKCIYRINSGILHKTGQNNSSVKTDDDKIIKNKNRIKKTLSTMMVPDSVIDWYFSVIGYLKEESSILLDVDVVLSISSPYTDHLISHYIYRHYGIKYILCYGDPWIYEPKRKRGFLRYQLEKRIEKRIVIDSAYILLITSINKNKYQEMYKINSDRVFTYEIGHDSDNKNKTGTFLFPQNIKMVYGGSLDPVHRNIIPFLEAIKEVNDITVDIYNNDFPELNNLIENNELKNKVFHHALLPADEYARVQDKYDALILFGNKTPFQIPGKLYTYISSGKTIFYIKNNSNTDDGTAASLERYGNYFFSSNNKMSILKELKTLKNSNGKAYYSNIEDFYYKKTMQPIIECITKALGDQQ